MALFTKKEEEKKGILIPPKRFCISSKNPLASILKSVLELGEEEDYKYLLKHSAKVFFSQNSVYLNSILVKSDDEMDVFVELLNYFLNEHNLGDVQIEVNEREKKVIITHYNSPFIKIHKDDVFLEEFYKILMELLIEKEIKITKELENEVQTFTVSID